MATLIEHEHCLHLGVRTETGNYRECNEDSVYADPDRCLFIVADGMGGHLGGETASATAIEVIPPLIEARLGDLSASSHCVASKRRDLRGASAEAGSIAAMIREAFALANREIHSLAQTNPKLHRMGTTLVLALVHDSTAYVCGIGDSRAYLVRSHRIKQLTTDHTLAQALIQQGVLTVEQARRHPYRNVLERYVGSNEMGKPEVVAVPLRAGDRLLLASDGLTSFVTERDMLSILEDSTDDHQAADRLVEQALEQGSRDNVSCVVVGY